MTLPCIAFKKIVMSSPGSSTRKRSVKDSKAASASDRASSGVQSGAQGDDKKKKKKTGVSWRPVCKTMGYFGLAFLIPTLLNYAVLNQESRMLVPEGRIKK